MQLLERALKEARKRGMTRAEFAREVIGCGPTKLWQVTNGTATLKPIETRLLKEWFRTTRATPTE